MCKLCKNYKGFLNIKDMTGFQRVQPDLYAVLMKDHQALETLNSQIPNLPYYNNQAEILIVIQKGQTITEAILSAGDDG